MRRTLADGRTEEVAWDEVNEVDAFRTRVGPHKPAGGGVVLYGTADRGCIIPFDKLEESSLLVHIHQLPGFDVGALITFVGADATAQAGADSTMALLSPKPLQHDRDAVDPARAAPATDERRRRPDRRRGRPTRRGRRTPDPDRTTAMG